MWKTAYKVFVTAGGRGAACFLLLLLLSPGLQAASLDTTIAGNASSGVGVLGRIFVVRGADNVIYYTFYQLRVTPQTSAGAFLNSSRCAGSPFTLDTDSNSNRWPDSNSGATPFRSVPSGASAASDPSIHLTTKPGVGTGGTAETSVLVSVRGNDGNIYWTVFDLDCDQTFTVPNVFTTAAGFGDGDDDGWPGPTTSSNPWVKAAN
jgi:hypothetical protein